MWTQGNRLGMVIYSSRATQLLSDEARIQGPTLSPSTLLFLIIKKIYLHLKERRKKLLLQLPSSLRMLATLMSDTDLLNYSVFFLFIRFY